MTKINCNGTFDSDKRRAGIGIVARDELGVVVVGSGQCFSSLNVENVEALAVYEGLQLVEAKAWQQIVIETDSEVVCIELMKTRLELDGL